jgi:hypothetical protein
MSLKLTVSLVGFPDTAIVRDVLSLSQDAVHIKANQVSGLLNSFFSFTDEEAK